MKKTTALLAASVLSAGSLSAAELSASVTFEWDTSYVFRGVKLADETFMPAVDISYGGFYAGIWTALPVTNTADNEIDYYAGYTFEGSDIISYDVGVTHYYYPDKGGSEDGTIEAYFGVSFETTLSPSFYAYYDFDLEAWTFEGAVGHSIEVAEKTTVELSGWLGYVEPDVGSGYYYYGVGAGVAYAFSDSVSASATLYYSGSEEDWTFNGETDDKELWVALAVTAGF